MPDLPPPASPPRPAAPPAAPPAWRRLWPLGLLLAGLGLAYALGLHRALSLDALATHRAALAGFVAARPVLAPLLYLGLYILVVGASLPGATVLTLAGGLLFGPWLGAAAAVAGATLGACLLFLAARHALAGALARRAGPRLARVAEGLRRDGFWVLLSLRFLPVLPFWLVNLAPALAGMRLAPYAAATFLGIIPATAVFAGIGAGLGQVLEAGGRPDLSVILSPGILLPLLGLAALSLLGAWWRRRRQGGRDAAPGGQQRGD
ncbi:TVP38/TMEM64 family protein [Roseicella frigidaeris]|uniref:TVP38/TMEM64 family membrane protein n=1 Tax=Roseicella frigidaeris TaxID=2230885 RepID=A0A327MBC5_9PROT|nr:VTT domain-containing protein [Roseicella frigidaeris]RAI59847.1 TVP38/TMEM64 family protein [Roseicella frigidaeris]